MNITRGKQQKAQRVVVYGPEGIGKSTFASQFPKPLFIDVESGTSHLDVARTDLPQSWSMLSQQIKNFYQDQMGFQSLVVDTADWAEKLGVAAVCAENNRSALGGQDDYGHSYNLLKGKWVKFLDFLTEIRDAKNINIVLLAHAQMRKFEQPEEIGAFDRWELKLQKGTAALTKEWPDMLLFANYKTLVVKVKGKGKGTGGKRVMYTTHHPCWDAKNRHDFPDEMPFEFSAIAHEIPVFTSTPSPAPPEATPVPETPPAPAPAKQAEQSISTALPSQLVQLMDSSNVMEEEIRTVVAKRGYYPASTPINKYEQNFIEGVLIAKWDAVVSTIKEMRGEVT